MGVRGFLSFLKLNTDYLADRIQVSDTSVVIDANDLLCQLYSSLCPNKSEQYHNEVYNIDLVAYGSAVKEFFTCLKICNITAILVFDGSVLGSRDLDGIVASKEKEVYRRSLDKFFRTRGINEFNAGENLQPTLNMILRNIASDFGIRRIQTPYEADSHIARVANELNCPVLTNDTNFIIYLLKKGFLLFDYFNYKKLIVEEATGKPKIDCMLYGQDKLVKVLPGLSKDCIPLVSMLDSLLYFDTAVLRCIAHIVDEQRYNEPLKAASYNHSKIVNLLDWMRGKSLEECKDFFLAKADHHQRPKIEKLIAFLGRRYQIETENNLEDKLEQIFSSDIVDANLRELNQTPVAFLMEHLKQSGLATIVFDMLFHKTYFDNTIMDYSALSSSKNVKFRPFSLALTLLRPKSNEDLTSDERRKQAEKDSLLLFDRVEDEYAEILLVPMRKLEYIGTLDHIDCYSMITLAPAFKRSLLMACFRFNQEEWNLLNDTMSRILGGSYIVDQAIVCFALVKYIGLQSGLSPDRDFVNALVITFFYYTALHAHYYVKLPILGRLKPHLMRDNYSIYNDKDSRRIMHFISQLLAAYEGFCLVNTLLGHVLPSPRLELFFDSTSIFRLTRLFWLKTVTIEDICKDMPHLLDACELLQNIVQCIP